ncbi:MAG TPA: SIS domain-containing protein [bacterium]|nr:SIS domain-containing protein [bacterium]
MNLEQEKYARYALVREMMEAIALTEKFDPARSLEVAAAIKKAGRLLLTGEGSSRIFPAKNAIRKALTRGLDLAVVTEGARQAAGYDLSRFAVFCASNSGKTREVVLLAQKLAAAGHLNRFALCAHHDTPLEQACVRTFVLNCGREEAVAATKSVVEQALFYDALLWHMGAPPQTGWQAELAGSMRSALTMPIDPAIIAAAVKAPTIYFAGYNDGVAEELTLKTNEITRKKSDFLEGTYAVHGIEEVMDPADVLFVIDPIADETGKFQEALAKGVGLTVIAISAQETPFPTIRVPEAGALNPYLFLTAGWNLLVEIGLAVGIDLDKPQRARKVGNEITG